MSLHQLHHPLPHLTVAIDVPLGRLQRGMSSQSLDVSQRSASGRNLPGCIGDEGPPSRVRRAAHQSQVPIPTSQLVHDSLSRGAVGPFGRDQGRRTA